MAISAILSRSIKVEPGVLFKQIYHQITEISAPLRQLLSKNITWYWKEEQMESFEKLKELVTEAPVLRYYNPKKDIVLTEDASSKGLEAFILQENQPIAYGSRALTDSQQN